MIILRKRKIIKLIREIIELIITDIFLKITFLKKNIKLYIKLVITFLNVKLIIIKTNLIIYYYIIRNSEPMYLKKKHIIIIT